MNGEKTVGFGSLHITRFAFGTFGGFADFLIARLNGHNPLPHLKNPD
ncbi:Uncharacterised protein [Vibrio cholerae]|uniref:Uncharacterized protein n=1 Tax=Vibrio cholerae TaxID=666 RepID=A0A655ZQS4_VIBCL|nr:Uncharacterised protein [Vibrio cholerae]CSC27190.1 Uncharacterised protein [Vibrio cholerae]CSC54031.1 Uncharacterised protein [Vibrio cholerae]CSC77180.1 Uncharacterised protein [Vibrio cholerae]CSC85126.1 Uncharacterised protein [Vibrio cholerae]